MRQSLFFPNVLLQFGQLLLLGLVHYLVLPYMGRFWGLQQPLDEAVAVATEVALMLLQAPLLAFWGMGGQGDAGNLPQPGSHQRLPAMAIFETLQGVGIEAHGRRPSEGVPEFPRAGLADDGCAEVGALLGFLRGFNGRVHCGQCWVDNVG